MSGLRDIMNGDAIKRIKEYLKKIKNRFIKTKSTPQIEIYSRTDHLTQAGPHIQIGNINNHSNRDGMGNVGQGDRIGHGITVKKQGKPKRCPYCASPARDENNNDIIVTNTSGGGKWYCKACESIF